jgi:hypothetical protein
MLINEVGPNRTILQLISVRVSKIASSVLKLVCPDFFFVRTTKSSHLKTLFRVPEVIVRSCTSGFVSVGNISRSGDGSVGMATCWMAGVPIPAVQECSLFHMFQIGCGDNLTSYRMGTEDSFPGDKAAGA